MDVLSVIGLVLGSSALTTLIGALFNRRKTNAEIKDSYADRLVFIRIYVLYDLLFEIL